MVPPRRPLSCFMCGSTTSTCCNVCVKAALSDTAQTHRIADNERTTARLDACEATSVGTALPELQDTSLRLRNEMDLLRRQCSAAAVRVYEWQMRNQERSLKLQEQQPHTVRSHLHRLEDAVVGSLDLQIRIQEERIRQLRYRWAIAAFWMHRVEVKDIPENGQEVSGVGKIGGLPLPQIGRAHV